MADVGLNPAHSRLAQSGFTQIVGDLSNACRRGFCRVSNAMLVCPPGESSSGRVIGGKPLNEAAFALERPQCATVLELPHLERLVSGGGV
jgi:hypothetical protein